MKMKYVCPKGCRLTKSGVMKQTGGPLICRKHKLKIESKEIICIDCNDPVKIGLLTNGKVRCDSCQKLRRNKKGYARKKKERADASKIRKSMPVADYQKTLNQEKPAIAKAKALNWPWKRSIRKPECKMYEDCFELVDYRKHNAKMNCGICACFKPRNEDPANYVTGEVYKKWGKNDTSANSDTPTGAGAQSTQGHGVFVLSITKQ